MADSNWSKIYKKTKKRAGLVATLAIVALILLNTTKELTKNLADVNDQTSQDKKSQTKNQDDAFDRVSEDLRRSYQNEEEPSLPRNNIRSYRRPRSVASVEEPEVEIQNNITKVGDADPNPGVASVAEDITNKKKSSSRNPSSNSDNENTNDNKDETESSNDTPSTDDTIEQTFVGNPSQNNPTEDTGNNTEETSSGSSSGSSTPPVTTPEIVSITSTSPGDGTYTTGQVIDIIVTFDEAVTTGTSSLTLDNGGTASYLSGSGSTAITYQYTAGASEDTSDLNVISFNVGDATGTSNAPSGTLTSGQNLADNQAIVLDTTGPDIVSIAPAISGDATYGNGATIDIVVTFDEAVTTSSSTLTLDTGGTAIYSGGSTTNTITYQYTVGALENTLDLDVTSFNVGDTIDGFGITALTAIPTGQNLADGQDIIIDNTAPTVVQVSSTKMNGTYTTGEVILIEVEFDEVVNYGGTPQLVLNSGATVDVSGGNGTDTLEFSYTVANGESSSDLDYVNTSSLSLNGGTIQDAQLNNADLTLALPGNTNSISDNQEIIIDAVVPTVNQVYSSKGDGTYGVSEVIDIFVEFSEVVDVDTGGGTPTLALDSGATVSYTSGSGTNTLLFQYTVGPAENSADLDYSATTSLVLNGATIRDSVLQDAVLTLANPNAADSISDDQAIVINTGAFTVDVYIRPTATGSADSCDVSPNPSLCYLTLSDFDGNVVGDSALADKDLVTQDANLVVHIQGDWSTAPGGVDDDLVTITGWTTDATHIITVQTEGVARHDGTANCSTCYRIDPSSAGTAFDISSNYITIDGVMITDLGSDTDTAFRVNGNNITIRNSITYDLDSVGTSIIAFSVVDGSSSVIENTLIYGKMDHAFLLNSGAVSPNFDLTLRNVLVDMDQFDSTSKAIYILGSGGNDWSGSMISLINTAILGNYTGIDGIREISVGVSPDYSGSSNVFTYDSSAQTVLGLDDTNSAVGVSIVDVATAPSSYDGNEYVIVNETADGSENYHLADSAFNLALGAGTDTTGTTPNDIDGEAITGAEHQIGPDFIADTTGPVVQEVYLTETDGTTTKPDGQYGNAATMSFVVEFSQVINFTSATLDINSTASDLTCIAHPTKWNAIKCDYTVGATDASLDLDYSSTTALSGTITDVAGNAAVLTLPTPGATYSASDNQDIQITAAATVVDVYVRPTAGDCTGGTPANPPLCYLSLDLAFTNVVADSGLTNQDLVTQNASIVVHIQDDWSAAPGGVDDDRFSIAGWTTDATHTITIQTEGVARHDGTANCTTCYKLDPSTSGTLIVLSSRYITLDGLILTGAESNNNNGIHVFQDQITLKDLIIHDLHPTSIGAGIALYATGIETFIHNNIIYGDMRFGILHYVGAGGTIDIDTKIRNTFVNVDTGSTSDAGISVFGTGADDYSPSTIEIVNSIIMKPSNGSASAIEEESIGTGASYTGSNRVLTGDGSAQSLLGLNNTNSHINVLLTDTAAAPSSYDGNDYVIVNETAAGLEDFHLVNNAFNLALGAGNDLTGTIPNDIDGDAITGAEHQIGPDFIADTTGPVVQEVYLTETDGTTTKPDGQYGNAATMSFVVEFSQVINVTGTPQITHNASATPVNCTAHPSMWNALECEYTVGATDASLDLDYASTSALALNGGTITDVAGNAAVLTLPTPGGTYSASDNQAVQITAGGIIVDVYVRESTCAGGTPANPPLCYTNLDAAFDNVIADSALTSKDLVTQNANIVVHIQDAWTSPDPNPVTITGYTTDATHKIVVQTEGTSRHDGDASCTGSCYVMNPTVSGSCFTVGVDDTENDSAFTEIDGFICTGTEAHFNNGGGVIVAANGVRVSNAIIYDLFAPTTANNGGAAFELRSDNTEIWLENILAYGDVAKFLMVWSTTASNPADPMTIHIYNSLMHATNTTAGRGILLDDSGASSDVSNMVLDIRNTAFLGTYVTAIFQNLYAGTPSFTGTTNVLTSDGTAQSAFGLNNTNSAINVSITDSAPGSYDGNNYYIVTDLTGGAEDYHLVDNAHNLPLGGGSNLTGSVPNDYEGDAITGTQNQIGPDFIADTTGPVVQEVYITEQGDGTTLRADGQYGNAATMSFVVEFSQVINFTSATLDINSTASDLTCIAHPTKWNAIKCDYTVGATDASLDLDYSSTTALSGTITDVAGNAAVLTLPTPGATYSASDNQDIQITAGTYTLDIYIRENCVTPTPPGQCYTTLGDFDGNVVTDTALNNKDLVTQNAEIVVHIDQSWSGPDTSSSIIGGWTTDATHFITIQTEGDARHDGTAHKVGAYELDPSASIANSGFVVDLDPGSDYTVLDGLVVTGIEDASGAAINVTSNNVTIKNTILHDLNAPSGTLAAVVFNTNNLALNVENTLIYGTGIRYGFYMYQGQATVDKDVTIRNSFIYLPEANSVPVLYYGPGGNDWSASSLTVVNSVLMSGATNDVVSVGTPGSPADFSASSNVITSDDTAQTSLGLNSTNSAIDVQLTDVAAAPSSYDGNDYVIVAETASGTEDFHLVNNALNLALGAGVDSTGIIANDIDGEAITGSQHQIGPDFIADTTGPVVQEVYITETDGTTTKPDGVYGNTDTMAFVIEFSQVINFTSATLAINSGASDLTCAAHATLWNAIQCNYTVGATDSSADLDYSSTAALTGTITDVAGNAATLTLPSPGATYSASDDQAIIISDGTLHAYLYDDCGTAPASDIPCYEELNLWNTANGGMASKDLVTQDVSHVLHIKGTWTNEDPSVVDLSGWNADATHTLTIITEGAARHSGVEAAGNYILSGNPATAIIIAGSDYTTIDGFIIDGSNINSTSEEGVRVTGTENTIQNMIIRNFAGAYAQADGVHIQAVNNINLNIYNTIFHNITRSALAIQGTVTNSNFRVYNVTAHNVRQGVPGGGTVYPTIGFHNLNGSQDYTGSVVDVRNTYAEAVEPGYNAFSLGTGLTNPGAWHASSGNNISDDDSAPGANSITNVTATDSAIASYDGNKYIVFTNLTASSEDFHLQDNAFNMALGAGQDTTGTIATDIDGAAITASDHQVGADFIADTTSPVATEAYITDTGGAILKPDAAYGNAETMAFVVEFSQAIDFTAATLDINSSTTDLTCAAHASLPYAIQCDYTVGASDTSFDLDYSATTSLTGTISDNAGNAATLTLPAPGATYSASNDQAVVINAGGLTLDIYVRETTCAASPNPSLCYTTLAGAANNMHNDSYLGGSKDLVTNNTNIIVHIQETWAGDDTSQPMFQGWTSDATRTITIIAEGDARHDGRARATSGRSNYRLNNTSIPSSAMGVDFMTVDGLEFSGGDTDDTNGVISATQASSGGILTLKNLIFANVNGVAIDVWGDASTDYTVKIQNSLFYNIGSSAFLMQASGSATANKTVEIENSTIHNACTNFNMGSIGYFGGDTYTSSNIEVTNSYIGECALAAGADRGFNPQGGGTFTGSNYNLHFHDNAIGSNSINGVTVTASAPTSYDGNKYLVVTDLAASSEDFTLVDNAWNFAFSGTDLSGNFDPDEDNEEETITNWYHIGPDWTADTLAPVVNEVYLTNFDGTTTKPDGSYGNGAEISFVVEFSGAIVVTGTPQITHNASATPVDCAQHSSLPNALECEYTVGASDASADLDFANTTALALNGGTITDLAGNAATLTLPTPGATYSASDNQDIVITAGGLTLDIYVREDCVTPAPPGQCYTSLASVDGNIVADTFLANKDLVTQNTAIIIHIDQAWTGPDTGRADFNGYTTSATNNITIQTEGAARHDGTANCASCYVMDPTGTGSILEIGASYDNSDTAHTVIDGLILTGSENASSYGIRSSSDGTIVKNTIVHDMFNSTDMTAFVAVGTSNVTFTFENFIVYNVNRPIVYAVGSSGTVTNVDFKIHNSLLEGRGSSGGTGYGIWADGPGKDMSDVNFEIINTAFFDLAGAAGDDSASVEPTYTGSTNIITFDDSAQTRLGLDDTNSQINVSLIDVAAAPTIHDGNDYYIVQETAGGSEDFHLADNAFNFALGAGVDNTANITNDIDNDLITGTQNQIGPDFRADTTGPKVQEVYITELDGETLKPDSTYNFGASMAFVVEFSQVINFTSATLDINSTTTDLTCAAHATKWNAIICNYAVGVSDASLDLDYSSTTALTGTITDKAGNAADLTLPAPGGTYSASNDQAVQIVDGMNVVDVYIRPSATGGTANDCDEAAISGSACYTTIADVPGNIINDTALVDKDLLTQNATVIVHIQGDWTSAGPDTATNVWFDGWTTDATHNLSIIAEGTARHDGTYTCSTCYKIDPSGAESVLIFGNASSVTNTQNSSVDGFIITGLSGDYKHAVFSRSTNLYVRNMIFYDLNSAGSLNSAVGTSYDIDIYVSNTMILGDSGWGIQLYSIGANDVDLFLDNSIIHLTKAGADCLKYRDSGSWASSNVQIRNSILICPDVIEPDTTTGVTYTGSTNVITSNTDAVTVMGLDGSNSVINAQITDTNPGSYDGNKYVVVTDLTPGSEDYHLVNNAYNIAQASGFDLTATYSEDIDGDTVLAAEHQIGPDYLADTAFPVVNEVYITETDGTTIKPDGTYYTGETMSFIVEFSQKIAVTGSPELTIGNVTNTALTCAAHGSLWNALKCDYTVAGTDSSADLDYLNTSALALAGGTIEDLAGNTAILTLPAVNGLYSASDNQAIVIDNNQTVLITSAPPINDDNKAAYVISGTCSNNGTGNVDIDVGGVTDTVDCSGGAFTSTLNVSALGDSNITCPTEFVLIERNTEYTDEKFCVARFEMKNVAGTATSQAAGNSWDNISYADAVSECQSLGAGFDLITNSQWQTIAQDIEQVASNWSSGVVGTGSINRGHSDGSPAAYNLAVSDINNPYSDTGNNSGQAYGSGGEQKRNHTLSNGLEIWDLAGNTWELVKDTNPVAYGATIYASVLTSATNTEMGTLLDGVTRDAKGHFGTALDHTSLGATEYGGFGRVYTGLTPDTHLVRGGRGDNGVISGIFSMYPGDYTTGSTTRAFRCIGPISNGYLVAATHYAATDSVTVSKDTVDPAAPAVTGPSSSSTLATFTQTITGSCLTGAIVSISGDVLNSPVKRECIGGSFSIEVTFTAGDDIKSLTIDQTDLEGNASNSVTQDYDVFGTAPTIAITSSPDINPTNYTSYTLSGTCTADNTSVIDIAIGTVTDSGINCSGGTWSTTVDVSSLADNGSISVTANYGVAPSATDSTTIAKSMAPYDNGANLQFTNALDTDGNNIAVTWTAFSDTNLTDHRLKTYTDPACTQNEVDHGLTGATTNSDSVIIDGLSDGVYWATVTAVDGAALETTSDCSADFITINTLAGTYSLPTSGMELWLDGDQQYAAFQDTSCSTAVTANDDPVGCALDLSGNLNHGKQTTASERPLYKINHQNSRNSFGFANDAFVFDNESNFDFTGNQYTIFIVFRVDSFTVTWETIFSKGDQSFGYKRYSTSGRTRYETGASVDPSNNFINGDTSINDAKYRISTHTFKDGLKTWSYDNKAEGFSLAPETYLFQNDYPVMLGGDAESTGRNLRDAYVAEFIIYDRKLSAVEIANVEGYLSYKWGTAFIPSSLTNIAVWFDSNDLNTLYQDATCTSIVDSNADPVGCWQDKSGNGNHAVQTNSGMEPVYSSASQTVNFDGTDDQLDLISDVGMPYGGSNWDFFISMLADVKATTPVYRYAFGLGASVGVTSRDNIQMGQRVGRCWGGSGGSGDMGTAYDTCIDPGNNHQYNINYDGTDAYLVQDSSVLDSDLSATITVSSGIGRIGNINKAVSENWDGDINEILLFNTDLSVSDRQKVEGYLACKWGTQGNLPGGHPYSATCP